MSIDIFTFVMTVMFVAVWVIIGQFSFLSGERLGDEQSGHDSQVPP